MRQPEVIHFSARPRDIRLGRPSQSDLSQEQLRTAVEAAYARGRVEGERALSEQLLQQRNELVELHDSALAALRGAVPQVIRQSEDAMVSLALTIAQKLVAESPITRDIVAANVREALEQVEDTTEFTVVMHPHDLELLGPDPSRVLNAEVTGHKMRFTPSVELSRGGCLIQTRFGTIDTRRETKLAHIAESLGLEPSAAGVP